MTPQTVRMTIRTVLRLFLQFSREFVKLNQLTSNERYADMSMERRMMRLHFAKLRMICPLLGGPKYMLFWTRKEKTNAI